MTDKGSIALLESELLRHWLSAGFLLRPCTFGFTIEPLTREHRAAALGRAAVALLYPCPGGRGRR